MWRRGKFAFGILFIESIILITFALIFDYDNDADGSSADHSNSPGIGGQDPLKNSFEHKYYLLQDVQQLLLLASGLTLTLGGGARYNTSAIGLNLLIVAIGTQWALLMENIWNPKTENLILRPNAPYIDVSRLIDAAFAVMTVLISHGAIMGRLSPLQLLMMAIFEITLFSCNETLVLRIFKARDTGGGMYVHLFAAAFGIGISLGQYRRHRRTSDAEPNILIRDPAREVVCLIGTCLSWFLWPSFNAIKTIGDKRHRSSVNSFLSVASSTASGFMASSLFDSENRIKTADVFKATVSGAVIISSVTDLQIEPFMAILLGLIAALIPIFGSKLLFRSEPWKRYLRDQPSLTIFMTHGLPAMISGLLSAIYAGVASEDIYSYSLYDLYPARAPGANSKDLADINIYLMRVKPGLNRSAAHQAIFQLFAFGTSIAIGATGGLVTGLILRMGVWDPLCPNEIYEDRVIWKFSKPNPEQMAAEEDRLPESERGMLFSMPKLPRVSPV